MDVTAQVLHDVEFREAKRGGYNTQDVDEFLERLAVAVDRQEAQVREARQRAVAAETWAADAERRAEEAGRQASGTSEADETLKRTLVLAQRTADAAIREAEERAAQIVTAAEDESARMLTEAHDSTAQTYARAEEEARQAQQDARTRVLSELGELERLRDQLRADTDLLERHIEGQRSRLQMAARELQALIDDPAALGVVGAPTVSDVTVGEQVVSAPPRQLVASPVDESDDWVDGEAEESWSGPEVDSDAYHPPPPAPIVRRDRDETRDAQRPLLAESPPAGEEDDAYLAELRKAMADDRPLGPRDDEGDTSYDAEREGPRSRFGRRR